MAEILDPNYLEYEPENDEVVEHDVVFEIESDGTVTDRTEGDYDPGIREE